MLMTIYAVTADDACGFEYMQMGISSPAHHIIDLSHYISFAKVGPCIITLPDCVIKQIMIRRRCNVVLKWQIVYIILVA